jgi:hypothetical protein
MRIGRQRSGGQSGDNPVFRIGSHRPFEQPSKPNITERDRALAKKRQELARVLESLKAPDVPPGIAQGAAPASGAAGGRNRRANRCAEQG